MIHIRPATDNDFDAIWPIFHAIVARGDSYPYAPDTNREAAHHIWMIHPGATYVAFAEDEIAGTYYIKPNQPGLGSHVCNAGYMVHPDAQGRGVGRAMCAHSLEEARRLGFSAMQYNLVVSTNTGAVRLWQDMGFAIVGTLPMAFRHGALGLVDAYVMYQWLA